MHETLRLPTRMDRIQAPIIAVIGALIREVPGTISLGQGVVHYGPPPAALEAVRAALAQPATHEYQDGHGLPALISADGALHEAVGGIGVVVPGDDMAAVASAMRQIVGMPAEVRAAMSAQLKAHAQTLTRKTFLDRWRLEIEAWLAR